MSLVFQVKKNSGFARAIMQTYKNIDCLQQEMHNCPVDTKSMVVRGHLMRFSNIFGDEVHLGFIQIPKATNS